MEKTRKKPYIQCTHTYIDLGKIYKRDKEIKDEKQKVKDLRFVIQRQGFVLKIPHFDNKS
jgi:hypothetical protein